MPTIVELAHVTKRRAELKLLKIHDCSHHLYQEICTVRLHKQQTKRGKQTIQVYSGEDVCLLNFVSYHIGKMPIPNVTAHIWRGG